MTAYWCEHAWLGGRGCADNVLIEVDDSRITAVTENSRAPGGAIRLAGLTIPGFANCHSHTFHRALRGRTQRQQGSFWTWREAMYDVAGRLDPDSYYALALATYREMLLTGITAVGEFHYLHHCPDGTSYDEPNAMGLALVAAARDAGMRISLLDACYLSSGFGAEPQGVQRRFSDGTAAAWAQRAGELEAHRDSKGDSVVIGAAIHSVRAVPRDDLATVAEAFPQAPVHVHLSEQVAENDACVAAYGLTPTQLLAYTGVVSSRLSAVHATHLTDEDSRLLGEADCYACFCPTTERDLADGVGPAVQLRAAGVRLTLGSDSHAVIDPFEEMRAVELNTRLMSHRRGQLTADTLLQAGTMVGHESLGFSDAGGLAVGEWADLVTIDLESPRTAGTGGDVETVVFAAGPADVRHVVASGRPVDVDPGDVGSRLARAVSTVLDEP